MTQNDVFYRHATSGFGEIANLKTILTKCIRKSGYLYTIPGGTNPQTLRKPVFSRILRESTPHFSRFQLERDNSSVTDGLTDQRTNEPTDGQSLL